jgi:hypothetical protein
LYGFYVFSEPLKALVEKLEPDVHQFRHVEIFLRDGSPSATAYYAVNIMTTVDHAIDFARSAAPAEMDPSRPRIKPLREIDSGRVVVSSEAVCGKHLWITEEIMSRPLTVSNHLFEQMTAKGYAGGYRSFEIIEKD